MNSLFSCDEGPVDWRFRLFSIPVRVQLWFWLTLLLMGSARDLFTVVIWMAVCFVSILWHELGHVFAFRAFGVRAEAVLWAWGGMAVPLGSRRLTYRQEMIVSAAGPAAGFSLAALTTAVAWAFGATISFSTVLFVIPTIHAVFQEPTMHARSWSYANILLNDLLWVNFYWSLINLLPVYPLDGSGVAGAWMAEHDPYNGRRRSYLLSTVVAALLAVLFLREFSIYLTLMFGVLAYWSYQTLKSCGGAPGYRPQRQRGW